MEFENLLTLIKAVSDSELTEFEFEENGTSIHFVKEQPAVIQQPAAVATVVSAAPAVPGIVQPAESEGKEAEQEPEGNLVRSPLVGTFYTAPAEDADPFVAVGDTVKKGQTLAIVEAMKLMNEIESEFDGVVEEVYVQNGQAVEYGQPLFRIR